MILNSICKEGRFLVIQHDDENQLDGVPSVELNESIIRSLATLQAKYLLCAIQTMIHIPDKATGIVDKQKVLTFEDLSKAEGLLVGETLEYFCHGHFADSSDYILEMETRFSVRRSESTDVETWSAMWQEVFQKTLVAARKAGIADASKLSIEKLLPPPKNVITKSFLRAEKTDRQGLQASPVKQEQEENGPTRLPGQNKEANDVPSTGIATGTEVKTPYFQKIYTAAESVAEGSNVHSLDILALQSQLQHYLFMHAGRLCCNCIGWKMFFSFEFLSKGLSQSVLC